MKNIYKEINQEYQKERDKNKRILQERHREIREKFPQIKKIEQNIRTLGLEAVKLQLQNPTEKGVEIAREEMKNLKAMKESILVSNGYRRDYLDEIYTCKYCKDRGYLEDGSRCSCYTQKLARKLYRMSNMERMIKKQNFATFDINIFSNQPFADEELTPRENMEEILKDVRTFIETFDKPNGMNLLFYGSTGLGKTFLSNCIARELLDRNFTVVYQTAFTLLEILERHKFHRSADSDIEVQYDLLFNCDLLIIDDLGTELSNRFTTSEIFSIVNTRLIGGKKTLISTNLTPQEISNVYTDRVFSRIYGNFVPIHFFGPDLRWE